MNIEQELQSVKTYRQSGRFCVREIIEFYQEGELTLSERAYFSNRSQFIEQIICGRPHFLFLSRKGKALKVVEQTDEIAAILAFCGVLSDDDCARFKVKNGWALNGGEILTIEGLRFIDLPESITKKFGRLMRYSFDVFEVV